MWSALQSGPQGWKARAGGLTSPAGAPPDATNDDVAKALQGGPQGASVAAAPWYEHYPALAAQAATNALGGTANLAIGGFNVLNRNLPKDLQVSYQSSGKSNLVQLPEVPALDLGDVAKPQGIGEHLAAAGVGGGAVALASGGVGDIPAILEGSGKELLGEVPALLRQAGVLGVAPSVAAEGADQLGLKDAPPAIRQGLEIATGMVAAIAAHRFAGGNPFETIPTKLGKSETANDAGYAAQLATRDWRAALPAKVEALKGITFGPLDAEGTTYGEKLFGKIPLDTATADMSETMKVAAGLNAKLGIFKDFPAEFGDNMPPRIKALLDRLAAANNPIVEYPPKSPISNAPKSAGSVGEVPPQMTGGPMPPYGPTTPQRADTFQSLQTVPGPSDSGARAVGEALPPLYEAPKYETPQGTITGFKAPLKDVMALRSYIGDMTSRGVFKGNDAAQVDAIYKGLSADLGNVAKDYGALPEFNNYNAATSQLYTDGAKLSKFSNDDNPTKDTAKPGEAVTNMWGRMPKDVGDIATIRQHLPEAADEIASAYLRQSPEGFIKLLKTNPDAAKALVPNPFDRLALSTAAPDKSSPLLETRKTREMVGSGFGLMGLIEAYNQSHPGSPLLSPFTAAAIGAGIPPAARFAAKISANPRVLKIPATGAAAVSPLLGQSDTTE